MNVRIMKLEDIFPMRYKNIGEFETSNHTVAIYFDLPTLTEADYVITEDAGTRFKVTLHPSARLSVIVYRPERITIWLD